MKLNHALCIWSLAMCAAVSSGAVVVFDNSSAAFTWVANGGASNPGAIFDPTLAPSEQGSFVFARSLGHFAFLGGGSNTVGGDGINGAGASIRLARETTAVIITGPQPGQETSFLPATRFLPGQAVGPEENYQTIVATGYFNPNLGRHNLLGDPAFIGFRVTLGDGLPHFGWIELDYRDGFSANGEMITMYQPIRWAYETLPNTPITVPTLPGAALLLAGAAALAGRPRRN